MIKSCEKSTTLLFSFFYWIQGRISFIYLFIFFHLYISRKYQRINQMCWNDGRNLVQLIEESLFVATYIPVSIYPFKSLYEGTYRIEHKIFKDIIHLCIMYMQFHLFLLWITPNAIHSWFSGIHCNTLQLHLH